ncbi:AI-2E family transporter [Advenella kashmirensis]|uniref:AI-2E family transporter n=1 Tax=Advenella kashmirensis TaxID=310575 RepID=UPI00209D11DF|nr:AI-2E family transporter [Advenella kashmirensis]
MASTFIMLTPIMAYLNRSSIYFNTFIIILIAASLAFFRLLVPFYGAIFWAIVLAVLFRPLQVWILERLPGRNTTVSIITLIICLLIAIIPLILISISLINESVMLYQRVESGQFNMAEYIRQISDALPESVRNFLAQFEIYNLSSLYAKISSSMMQASKYLATQAFDIGQNFFAFLVEFCIMLYLLFFLLKDGPALTHRIKNLIPLTDEHKQFLFQKFNTVVRATVKGNVVIAAVQGLLGGLIFWILGIQGALLWGVVMGFLSLLPAVGAAIVWLPVAVYFLVTGNVWNGAILILFGFLVIGLSDNILRPLLVGKDTKMPDYLVLISTLGGLSLFGLTGFVIGPLIAAMFIAIWDLFPAAVNLNDKNKAAPATHRRPPPPAE